MRPYIVALVASALLAGCSKPPPQPEPLRAVRVQTVGADRVTTTQEYAAEIRARTESRLAFRVGGKVVRRLADTIANNVVIALDRNAIRTLDDLATNERLMAVASATFDIIPATIRALLSRTVGRPFIEERIFEMLLSLRASVPPHTRTSDLRGAILGYAPLIARKIDDGLILARQKASAMVSSSWTSTLGSLWGSPQPAAPRLAPAAP